MRPTGSSTLTFAMMAFPWLSLLVLPVDSLTTMRHNCYACVIFTHDCPPLSKVSIQLGRAKRLRRVSHHTCSKDEGSYERPIWDSAHAVGEANPRFTRHPYEGALNEDQETKNLDDCLDSERVIELNATSLSDVVFES